jgi:hypothetical protein
MMTEAEQYKTDSSNACDVQIMRADVFECIELLRLAYFDDSDQVNDLIEKLESAIK